MPQVTNFPKGQQWRRLRDGRVFRVWSAATHADGQVYVRLTPDNHYTASRASGGILATTVRARYEPIPEGDR